MKVKVLRIFDADDNHEWGVHTSKESLQQQLYAYALDRWDGYEELPPSDELSVSEAIDRFFAEAEDYHWYEQQTLTVQGDVELPEETAFLTQRELLLTRIALANTNLAILEQGLAQENSPLGENAGLEVLDIIKKLEL